MANSYDISTVVSRSYISEQLQDNMQKGAENRNAEFVAQFQKASEKKGNTVVKTENSADSQSVKPDGKHRDKDGKNKKKREPSKPRDPKIDIRA